MRPRLHVWTVCCLLLALFSITALAMYQAERDARLNLKERLRTRMDAADTFLRSYVQEILRRERSVAELELDDAEISSADFAAVVRAGGFEAAVVMDSAGKAVQVYPATRQLQGLPIGPRYAHLRLALDHGVAVSEVVRSAAEKAPIVGFATRYETPSGPRVFSGAYDVRNTPLSTYLANIVEPPAHADLVDGSQVIVASSRKLTPVATILSDLDPALSKALGDGAADEYESERGRNTFFVRNVSGTPWRLVISAEQSALYAPLNGKRRFLNWLLFCGFCAALLVAVILLLRLRRVTALHARLARVDRLTDLPNRLHLEEHMARLVSAAVRQKRPLSVFIADVDHFKAINDTYGHHVGDEVLRALSARMVAALRAEDMLGRWGGEEFLALLPNTSAEGACAVANRVRIMASSQPIVTEDGTALQVTVSIGCATKADSQDRQYMQRADDALYSAKKLGRDRVVSSAPPAALPD